MSVALWSLAVLTMAVASSAMAAVVPFLRRDELPGDAWERKTAFALLLGDSVYQWWALAHVGGASDDPTWMATLTVLLAAGLGFALFLGVRGYEVPPILRWPLLATLGVLQPLFLVLSFIAVHGPVPLW